MRTAPIFLAGCAALLLSICASAQQQRSLDAQWHDAMRNAQGEHASLATLQEGLKIAEHFGESDPRLFESLVRLASFCQYDDDGPGKRYVERALGMRSKIIVRDAHFATLLVELAGAADTLGQHGDALNVYGDALQLREKLFGS